VTSPVPNLEIASVCNELLHRTGGAATGGLLAHPEGSAGSETRIGAAKPMTALVL